MRPPTRAHIGGRVRGHSRRALVAVMVLALAASCTSDPERRDLPDVHIDVSADPETGAPSEGPTPSVASEVSGLPGRLAVVN
ncbi:MAG TPA: hypothetical protein VFM40_04125, partial [Actinomycetota bacterium]|nr:hypothetical protein [Actinomycetota bacterium]